MAYAGIQVPAGCDVLIGDNEANLVNVGVLPEDKETTVSVSYDSVEVKGSKNEDVQRYVKNMSAEGKFSIYQILLDNIAKFSKGLITLESVPGTPVTGQTQTIKAGWENKRLYRLDGQNADGSEPTVTAKKGSTTLTKGDDFHVLKAADGDFYVSLNTAGTSHIATTDVITLTLGYTPKASVKAKMGAPSVEITPQVVRFMKMQGDKKFQITLWSATNSSGLSFAFPASSADKPTSIDVTMTGGLDTSRAVGDQLIEIVDEIGLT